MPSTPSSLKHKLSHDDITHTPTRAQMMNPQTFTTVKIGELPNDLFLPPLPPIEDKDIEKRVFTHSSTVTSAKSGSLYFQEEGESVDNEKLEYVGDGILKLICTTMLHDLWPNMREGPTTTIMGHLVSNTTLAQLSRRYNLVDRLQVAVHAAMTIKAGEKNQANVFESYIAGVFLAYRKGYDSTSKANGDSKPKLRTQGQATDHVAEWLVPLFEPVAKFIQESLHAEQRRLASMSGVKDETEISPAQAAGATMRLNEYFNGVLKADPPAYEHKQKEGLMWMTKCTVTLPGGEQLSAETVQGAKQLGKQITAYKLLLQLGLLKGPDST